MFFKSNAANDGRDFMPNIMDDIQTFYDLVIFFVLVEYVKHSWFSDSVFSGGLCQTT